MKSLALIFCLTLCVGCVAHKPSALAPPDLDPRHASFQTHTLQAQPQSVIVLPPPQATATPVCVSCQISWPPPSPDDLPVGLEMDHYAVYCGTSPREYTTELFTPDAETNGVVSGLASGTTYFFAVTAVYSDSQESEFSEEAVFTPALILELHFPNPGILQSSTDLVNWAERDAAFDGNVYRVSDPKWPKEFYRTTQ